MRELVFWYVEEFSFLAVFGGEKNVIRQRFQQMDQRIKGELFHIHGYIGKNPNTVSLKKIGISSYQDDKNDVLFYFQGSQGDLTDRRDKIHPNLHQSLCPNPDYEVKTNLDNCVLGVI